METRAGQGRATKTRLSQQKRDGRSVQGKKIQRSDRQDALSLPKSFRKHFIANYLHHNTSMHDSDTVLFHIIGYGIVYSKSAHSVYRWSVYLLSLSLSKGLSLIVISHKPKQKHKPKTRTYPLSDPLICTE